MNKNCNYLKQKLNKKLYCNKLKKRANKQVKFVKNRFNILTNDLNHCIICGAKTDHLHKVFFEKNRTNSIKYGLVIPLCYTCHTEMHKNIDWQDFGHKKG